MGRGLKKKKKREKISYCDRFVSEENWPDFDALISTLEKGKQHSFMKKLDVLLTHLFSIHPFSASWKHQKTLRFSVFRG